MDLEQREFRADPLKLKRLRVAAGLTVQDFAKAADLDRTTVGKILRGDPVFLKTLQQAGEQAFGISSPLELLHPDELAGLGIATEAPSPTHVLEWEIVEYLSGWEKTSNGLQYQRLRLKHRYLEDRWARAKCYELRHLATADRDRLEGHLRRHVEVSEQVGSHPNVAETLTAAWVGGMWWVLDRWVNGETLANRLAQGPLSIYELQTIMRGIAEGLNALHAAGVIRRELSPDSVLLRENDDRPILTDLELAKLNERLPTVSPEQWPDDPYRAVEVEGDAPIDIRADIYSWGRIFVPGATGRLPKRGQEQLAGEQIPEEVRRVVLQCVAGPRSKRPNSMNPVLTALKAWI
jgi:serine/threonine protein kinase/DNA-binding XRE family transcriptional regulator